MDSKIDFLFYSPDIEKSLALDQIESQHAVKVLRKKQGDIIQVTDGVGGWYLCEITQANEKECKVRINFAEYTYNKHKCEICVGISPTKNSDRIEYFVEKSIEIGISSIHFLKTRNTYPQKVNLNRIKKIAVSAMKQSLKAYLPNLSDMENFESFLKENIHFENKYIAHFEENSRDIMEVEVGECVLLLIGPEGDFSKEELEMAKKYGFESITLGKNRLRTETAGIFAVSVLNARTYL